MRGVCAAAPHGVDCAGGRGGLFTVMEDTNSQVLASIAPGGDAPTRQV
ncbi:hypothetical protein I552_8371 [Mycobacterium xenopi 3993]|nr:hypothetical protein I552_8371 [Mycobacterium xenopi 3993]